MMQSNEAYYGCCCVAYTLLTAWLSPATCAYDREITHSRYDALL